MKKGIPIAPGFAIGPARCIFPGPRRVEPIHIEKAAISSEVAKFDDACSAASHDLDDLILRVTKQLSKEDAAIFVAHRALLRDPAIVDKVKSAIREKNLDAAAALQQVLAEYTASFAKIEDGALKERLDDVRDVMDRIQNQLTTKSDSAHSDENIPAIIVAAELLPSQVAELDPTKVLGIVSERGGPTGHAAILARALDIPTVFGVSGLLKEIKPGQLVAIDGREGFVYVNPGTELKTEGERIDKKLTNLRDTLAGATAQDCVTADGVALELLANVGGPADAALAARLGARGVGLYRSEYLFLAHPSLPSEEEQVAAYKAVIEAAPNHCVTVRTIDIGEDKYLPLVGTPPEGNPLLGWRGIRLGFAYPQLLETQLQAILQVASLGAVKILLPMVSSQEEVQQFKKMIDEVRRNLDNIPVPDSAQLPLGAMVEVPAAALCIDGLLDEADFVSIGSNDLIQYLMAADRNSQRMAPWCEPYSVALYRLLKQVVDACNQRRKPVTLCGEMAGQPECLLPLLGMGLRSFSMSPFLLPQIRDLARHVSLEKAQDVLNRVLQMKTTHEIRRYLNDSLIAIWPPAATLATSPAPSSPENTLPYLPDESSRQTIAPATTFAQHEPTGE